MESLYLSLADVLGRLTDFVDRVLDRASQNLTFGKLLLRLGLDPNNLTLDAINDRLVEVVAAVAIAWYTRGPSPQEAPTP